jgi:hypothetical protein
MTVSPAVAECRCPHQAWSIVALAPTSSLTARAGKTMVAAAHQQTHAGRVDARIGASLTSRDASLDASGCFHEASRCFPDASGCFHEASRCFPDASGCFHEASRCFPDASGCLPDACGRLPGHAVADSAGEIAGTDQAVRIISGPGGRCAHAPRNVLTILAARS